MHPARQAGGLLLRPLRPPRPRRLRAVSHHSGAEAPPWPPRGFRVPERQPDSVPWLQQACTRLVAQSSRGTPTDERALGSERWAQVLQQQQEGKRQRLTQAQGADARSDGEAESSDDDADSSAFDKYRRVREDLNMMPATFSPQRHTSMVEGRPVQARQGSKCEH